MQWKRYTSLFLALMMLVTGASAAVADSGPDEDQIEAGWRAFQDEWGQSNASGNGVEVGNALVQEFTSAVNLIRVGLRYSYTPTGARSEFYSYNHPTVQLTGTVGQFFVVDQATGQVLATAQAGDVYSVKHDGTNYVVTGPDGASVGAVAGPVHFFGTDPENTMKVLSITRVNILTYTSWVTPEYRGSIEIARGSATPAGMVNVVNIVELESYLRGNVVNESPASFHEEALKTQAVSARGYALANIGRFTKQGYPFDIDDSPGSQVYRGKTSEHPNGDIAVEGTKGIVASYNGKIINAFYSSSMAGFTENYEWSFSGTGNPAQAIPYLVGRYDGPAGTEPDLSTEAGRRAFWANDQPQVYDSKASSGNGRNRWTFTLTRAQVEANLNARRSTARVVSGSAASIGTLAGCDPTLLSPTGRIVQIKCTGSNAVWEFTGWDNVRRAFPSPTLGVLNNPAFLDHKYNADGTLASITAIGGGWGHNVGMSQYGANGRGKAGQSFVEIMGFYFKDMALGTYPVRMQYSAPIGWRQLKQSFSAPTGHGVLEIRPEGGMKGLTVIINGTQELKLSGKQLAQPLVSIDITQYLTAGTNTVEYRPSGTQGTANAVVRISP